MADDGEFFRRMTSNGSDLTTVIFYPNGGYLYSYEKNINMITVCYGEKREQVGEVRTLVFFFSPLPLPTYLP